MNLSNYHIIILDHNQENTHFTVISHSDYNYNVVSGSREQIIKNVNCLWNRVDINRLVSRTELHSKKIVPILKKYTKTNNLDRCYFVWATDFKNSNI